MGGKTTSKPQGKSKGTSTRKINASKQRVTIKKKRTNRKGPEKNTKKGKTGGDPSKEESSSGGKQGGGEVRAKKNCALTQGGLGASEGKKSDAVEKKKGGKTNLI